MGAEIVREDALQIPWRARQRQQAVLSVAAVSGNARSDLDLMKKMLSNLASDWLVTQTDSQFLLTGAGVTKARELVHRHRVYEIYLGEHGLPADNVHETADRAEHFISPELEKKMDEEAGDPKVDAHGREIPHRWICAA